MRIYIPNCQDCPYKDSCKGVYLNNNLYCNQGENGEPYKTTSDFEVYRREALDEDGRC